MTGVEGVAVAICWHFPLFLSLPRTYFFSCCLSFLLMLILLLPLVVVVVVVFGSFIGCCWFAVCLLLTVWCQVVTTLVLCTVGSPASAVGEIARVLKSGGRYLCVEHILAEGGSEGGVGGVLMGGGGAEGGSETTRAGAAGAGSGLGLGSGESQLSGDSFLAAQQRLLDPLQVLLADG